MDFALDSEQELIRATFRRFADKQLAGWAADADREAAAPAAMFDAAGELGLFADAVPAAAGGLLEERFDHQARALRGFELGRGCAGLAALLESNVEPALAVGRWGSAAAKQALFDAIGAGQLAALHLDAAARLRVRRVGEGLEVDGAIGPLAALGRASHLLVATAGAEPALFLIAVAGRAKPLVPSSWRAAAWGRLDLEREAIAPDFVLGRGDAAIAAIGELAAWHKVSMAARAVGVATAAIEHATRYGEERIQFGQAIGTFESLARLRDENQTAISAARWLILHAAWQLDRGAAEAADSASRARALANQVVARATIDAVQIYGGYGFVNDFPVEKLMRDARPFEVVGGNDGLHRVATSRAARKA